MVRKNAKILQKKRKVEGGTKPGKPIPAEAIKEQYNIIRNDLLRLRNDLAKGYDMAKSWMDKHGNVRSLLKAK